MYTALYRKWRPKKFEDVCGQEQITTILKNQIKANQLSHAYLFCGTRGTGKTSTAKLLAKAVNCFNLIDGNPCDSCESCTSINQGNSMDVFEIDAASNRRIEDVRDLREAVKFAPALGKYKVYIIDEVHMLTNEAFNALLKTLEEPPAYVKFILATTEPHKLPATILSRCQRFDFKRLVQDNIVNRLEYICKEENIKADDDALRLIARNSDGAMRDAVSIMDQCAVFGKMNITHDDVLKVLGIVNDEYLFKMSEAILEENSSKAMLLIQEISREGKDMNQFARDLLNHYRNLLMAKLVEQAEDVIDLSKETISMLRDQSSRYGRDNIIRCINILSELTSEIKWSPQPKTILEVSIIKMCKLQKDISSDGLLARIEKLEEALARGEISITAIPEDKKAKKEEKKEVKKVPEKIKKADLKPLSPEIMEKWDGFIQEIKNRKKMKLRTYLALCKPAIVDGEKIMLCFTRQDSFSKEAVERMDTKKEIEEIACEYFSKSIKIKAIFEDEAGKIEDEGKDDAGEDDVVKKAIELFGEDLVEVVEEE
ncbi:DNA polymerase III subunit gamma/tau [Lutispora saccharofermentans]|uniref:DNA-directed DNA polymerase n=1 Tax=Lutispora saccharofermentans TaxID=3024236 RepID=A0ABT1NKF3_9FIRM|nr:DNA polymerase III subunit gamma/tau [Lutispora saccharofermentans]MCQ1531745.1 DNA polymerase III subunit gamma/tau [Lutispora saccharofermentans]